jgi:DNA-directed RNA polymerase specialized sigma24 family protein
MEKNFCPIYSPVQHRRTRGAIWSERLLTDKQPAKSEKVATVDEIERAVEKLLPEELAKLHAFAKNRARMMALHGSTFTAEDLVQQAIFSLLEERRHWNSKKVDFVGLLIGVMRSMASNYKQASITSGFAVPASQLASPEDDNEASTNETDSYADTRLNAEQRMVIAAQVAEVYDFFMDDSEAQLVLDGWLDHMSGTEIMDALEIDRNKYETIVRRIRRRSAARWLKGSINVR